MKDLNRDVAYHLVDLTEEQRGEIYDWFLNNDKDWQIYVSKEEFMRKCNDTVIFNKCSFDWYDLVDFKNLYPNKELTNALELFKEEQWQPKQGEEVLVSDDGENWSKRVFVLSYKNGFYCESTISNELVNWTYIKPFEEDIKVGDWVISELNDCVFKYQFSRLQDHLTKITNPQLIELLEQEIK